jgi:uncharacterized protein HemX
MSFIQNLNILQFIKNNFGAALSILLIVWTLTTTAGVAYFVFFKKDNTEILKQKLKKQKLYQDSLEIHIEIALDSVKVESNLRKELEKELKVSKQRVKNRNKSIADLKAKLEAIQKLKEELPRKMTNEERDTRLVNRFGLRNK